MAAGARPIRAVAVLIAVSSLIFGACIFPCSGKRISREQEVQATRAGTRDGVFAVLGEPDHRSPGKDGGELWGYYTEGSGCTLLAAPVYFVFDADGKLESTFLH